MADKTCARDEAVDWLRTALANGPQASADLLATAHVEGIARRTLQRASKRLGVAVERTGWPARTTWQLAQSRQVAPSRAKWQNMDARESPSPEEVAARRRAHNFREMAKAIAFPLAVRAVWTKKAEEIEATLTRKPAVDG